MLQWGPEVTDKSKRRMRIYQDEVKLRHTSHWDLDTMSRADFEAYMAVKFEQHAPAQALSDDPGARDGLCPAVAPLPTLWERFLRACLPAR